jgi:hypothetical protein
MGGNVGTKTSEKTAQSPAVIGATDRTLGNDKPSAYDGILRLQRAAGNRAVSELLQPRGTNSRPVGHQQWGGKIIRGRSGAQAQEFDSKLALLRRANADTGSPLDENVRVPLEQDLGVSLKSVRVHSNPASEAAAKGIAARAYTIGSSIHLGSRARNVSAFDRRSLLAHEAVHTVQQGARPLPLEANTQLSQPGDRAEVEADRIADSVMAVSAKQKPQTLPLPTQRGVAPIASRISSETMIQRQKEKGKEKEDWNFTPADYAELIKKKGELRIAEDSSWFPKKLQANLLNTLSSLLDPARKQSATEGVNVNDFYHGHVAVDKEVTRKLPTPITDKITAYYAELKRSQNKSQETVNKLAGELLSVMVEKRGIALIYHTFERNDPSDLEGKPKIKNKAGEYRSLHSGDPRRNYKTPLATNKPDSYSPPKKDDVGSWMQTHHNIMQFSFLVDHKGEVHIRAGNPNVLSPVTGAAIPK